MIHRGMVPAADSHHIFSMLYWSGLRAWTADRASQRPGRVADQIVDWKIHPGWRQWIVHRRDGTQVDHDGSDILIGKSAVARIGHHGENGAPVVADAFTDGSRSGHRSNSQRPSPDRG